MLEVLRECSNVRQLFCVVSFVLLALVNTVTAMQLNVDIGCPGQEASGYLKEGWVEFNGSACSGAVGPVTVTNIGGLGIDVTITVGNTSDNAYRSPSGYTGDEMGRDYISADESISQSECTMTMTLSNLPEALYTLKSYHNMPDMEGVTPATMDITISGPGVVGTPTAAYGVSQSTLNNNVLFENIDKGTVEFIANGTDDVTVTFTPQTEGHKWRIYLNGFELIGTSINPLMEFDSVSSANLETVSPTDIPVVLKNAEAGITYTVDYRVIGGTAIGSGVDYIMPGECITDFDESGQVDTNDLGIFVNNWLAPAGNQADVIADNGVGFEDFAILGLQWYELCEPGILQFNPGETGKTIEASIVNDGRDEGDETIVVGLSNPTASAGEVELGANTEHTYTIIESEPSVGFEVDGDTVREDVGQASIGVLLNHLWSDTITVDYNVTGGTASSSDYGLGTGTLTFEPNETSQTINLSIVDDSEIEETETIVITLSNPTNATIGPIGQFTLTVLDNEEGVYWDGKKWFYSESSGGPFVNSEGNLEWDPEKNGLFVTRIPEQSLSQVGDKVEISYMWMTDGAHDCYDCEACDDDGLICGDDDITCIAGTSDMRVGLFEADGEYVDQDGLGYSNSIFEGYKGYGWRFGPNMQAEPTRWVDCTGEVHKTGQFDKKDPAGSSLMHVNDDILGGEIPGFELPPGQYSLLTVSLERTGSSQVHLSITLNGKTETYTDDSGDQPEKIDVFAIHMRNGRPYTRLVLCKP